MKKFFIVFILLIPVLSIAQENSDEYFEKGNKFFDKKEYSEAIEMYNKAIEISPLEPEFYIYRGLARYYQQEYKEAIIDYTRTLEIQPDYAEAYNLRGIAKGDLGDKTGACEDWYKASDLGFNPVIKLIQEFCIDNEN